MNTYIVTIIKEALVDMGNTSFDRDVIDADHLIWDDQCFYFKRKVIQEDNLNDITVAAYPKTDVTIQLTQTIQ